MKILQFCGRSVALVGILALSAAQAVGALSISVNESVACVGCSVNITVHSTPDCDENETATDPQVTIGNDSVAVYQSSEFPEEWTGSYTPGTSGSFTAVVNNGCDPAASTTFTATELTGFTKDPNDIAICVGGNITYTAQMSPTDKPECLGWSGDITVPEGDAPMSITMTYPTAGEKTVTVYMLCNINNDCTETIKVIEVATLTMNGGDVTGATFLHCKMASGTLTVTATANPSVSATDLPACWTATDTVGSATTTHSGTFTVTVDLTVPASHIITFTAGTSSRTVTIKVVSAEVKAVLFTSDHGVLTDYNTDYVGEGGTVFSPRGWQKSPAANNPVTHQMGSHLTVNVKLVVEPSGVDFKLLSTGDIIYPTGSGTATGTEQMVSLTSTTPLHDSTSKTVGNTTWSVRFGGQIVCATETSGPHTIYGLLGVPTGDEPTLKRVSGVVDLVSARATELTVGVGLRNYLKDQLSVGNPLGQTSPWRPLDPSSPGYDCLSLAKTALKALQIVGGSGGTDTAMPSTDADYSDYETSNCNIHGTESLVVMDSGPNLFEGCLTVNVPYAGLWITKYIPFWPHGGVYDTKRDVIAAWVAAGKRPEWWNNIGYNVCNAYGRVSPVPMY